LSVLDRAGVTIVSDYADSKIRAIVEECALATAREVDWMEGRSGKHS
jgi:hypothetical protein